MQNSTGYFFARSSDVQTSYSERDLRCHNLPVSVVLGMWIREGGHYRGNCTDTESLHDSSRSFIGALG